MLVKRFSDCKEIAALDGTILRELLNPRHEQADLKLDYSLAHAVVRPGQSSIPHRFCEASEVYYIIQGTGRMHVDSETSDVSVGDTVYIPPMGVQYIENIGDTDLVFLCVVSPSWYPDAEELVE
jgi:mannose-6-phosphate isomerase-like protein (cupin superfamily)